MSAVNDLRSRGRLALERARADRPAVDVIVRTGRRFSDDDCGTLAASLTYYLFFSVFPLLLFAASILGRLTFANEELRQRLFEAGVQSVPLLAEVLKPDVLSDLGERSGGLALTALVLALYAGTGGIVALQHALNKIHRIQGEPGWLGKRVRALKWLGVIAAGGLLSTGVGVLAGFAGGFFGGSRAVVVSVSIGARIAGLAIGIGLFAFAYKVLPNLVRSWREVLPGAVLVALVFEVLKIAGASFLTRGAQSREATFGAFATAAGFLVAAYLLAQVILLGAVLNSVLAERRALRATTGGDYGTM